MTCEQHKAKYVVREDDAATRTDATCKEKSFLFHCFVKAP